MFLIPSYDLYKSYSNGTILFYLYIGVENNKLPCELILPIDFDNPSLFSLADIKNCLLFT
jgi:hypothetical protein